MEELKILICSQNDAVCARAERYLALWRETFCVRCAAERLDWEALPAREGAICFLDLTGAAANGNEPRNAATVVIAANDAQAIESYRHHPAAFLPDGFGYAEFCEAMGKCYPFWRQHLQWLELSFHRRPVRLPLCQLRYAEADGRETVLHCDGVTMRASAYRSSFRSSHTTAESFMSRSLPFPAPRSTRQRPASAPASAPWQEGCSSRPP